MESIVLQIVTVFGTVVIIGVIVHLIIAYGNICCTLKNFVPNSKQENREIIRRCLAAKRVGSPWECYQPREVTDGVSAPVDATKIPRSLDESFVAQELAISTNESPVQNENKQCALV